MAAQELGLIQMEEALQDQEESLDEEERSFLRKSQALISHANYILDQQQSLIRRAEAMGPQILDLAVARLNSEPPLDPIDPNLGQHTAREAILAQRQALYEQRLTLLESREALFAQRSEELERAKDKVYQLQNTLGSRESLISQTAREVFTAASTIAPVPQDAPMVTGRYAKGADGRLVPLHEAGPSPQMGTQPSPQADQPSPKTGQPAPITAENVPRPVRIGAPSTTGARIRRPGQDRQGVPNEGPLKVALDGRQGHHLFVYADDVAQDIPGLFVATEHLPEIGRQFRVRASNRKHILDVNAIVAWRREYDDEQGKAGFGLELLNLNELQRERLRSWALDFPPVVI